MGSGEDAQFVFAKYDYTAQGNQVTTTKQIFQGKLVFHIAFSDKLYEYLPYLDDATTWASCHGVQSGKSFQTHECIFRAN